MACGNEVQIREFKKMGEEGLGRVSTTICQGVCKEGRGIGQLLEGVSDQLLGSV